MSAGNSVSTKINMLVTRRQVVEEKVTEVVSDIDAWITTQKKKQDPEEQERMRFEKNRLDSFDSSWLNGFECNAIDARRLAKAGFYHHCEDRAKCFCCGLTMRDSSFFEGHDPDTVHRLKRPSCAFVTGQSDNVPTDTFTQKITKYITNIFYPSTWINMPIDNEQQKNDIKRPNIEQNSKINQKMKRKAEKETDHGKETEEKEPDVKGNSAPEYTAVIASSAQSDEPSDVHQRSVTPCLINSSDDIGEVSTENAVKRQKLCTSAQDIRKQIPSTSKPPDELEQRGASGPNEEKTLIATRSIDICGSDQETLPSECSRNCREDVTINENENASGPGDDSRNKMTLTCTASETSDSAAVLQEQTTTGDVPDEPLHPHYALESLRLSTFRTWGVQSPETLCKAGFFYTGKRDVVRCFHCDGSLCNWEHAHNPFTEHKRWYPNCAFIKGIRENEVNGHGNENVTISAVVKPTTPVNTGAILESLIRENQETQRKVQQAAEETNKKLHETGKKLHVLMEAVSYEHNGPHPALPVQQTISTQRQAHWSHSSQNLSGSYSAMVSRSDHLVYSQQMIMAPPVTESLQRGDQTVLEHHMILMKIASVITTGDELTMLGIHLGCDPNDVRRLKNGNPSLKDAAYEILCAFYNFVPNKDRWGILAEALREQKKNLSVKELKLEELHQGAQIGT